MNEHSFDHHPLTKTEKAVLKEAAAQHIVDQTGVRVSTALDMLNATDLNFTTTDDRAQMYSNGFLFVNVPRDWLSFHAITGTPVDLSEFNK